ncbi:hypothetical protein [Sphingobium subterraneum]|uniref:DUF3168 domain-containing protein n=1 Tax=Sphingobium subterraneum TaxID=627688 RepID=A0A841IYD9_9SPHN|nr:hypothetical protein [Sphingobium subterraneum]MBB6123330.1 hypothetical protein [Sphingobium subterraneum]
MTAFPQSRRAAPGYSGSITVPRVKPRPHVVPETAATREVSPPQSGVTRRDPLGRLISQLVQLAGPDAYMAESTSRPWASATFVGAQHVLTLCIGSAENSHEHTLEQVADRFAHALPEADFRIPGHIVADIVIDERRRMDERSPASVQFRITALTIEDW